MHATSTPALVSILVSVVACSGKLTSSGGTVGSVSGSGGTRAEMASTGMGGVDTSGGTVGMTNVTTGPAGASPGTGTAGGGAGGCAGICVDPVPNPCMTSADCDDQGDRNSVCTVANRCGKILGPCTTQTDCIGDAYCCAGPMCRKDDAAPGVCIPGNVPPGYIDCGDAGDLPDLTVRLSHQVGCRSPLLLEANVCNRGNLPANAHVPVAFYLLSPSDAPSLLCVAYTGQPLPIGMGCMATSCLVNLAATTAIVTVVVNDDGRGGRTDTECRYDNNSDTIGFYCEGPP